MTQRVLLVVPDLEYNGTTTQLAQLAGGLSRAHFQLHVCVLGRTGPVSRVLRSAGVEVTTLEWSRPFDLNPLRRLRQLIASSEPDVIHAWRPTAFRAVRLAQGRFRGRLIASSILEERSPLPRWARRWLVRPVDDVAVSFATEAQCYRELGLAEAQIHQIPRGVELGDVIAPGHETLCRFLGLAEGARLLMCAGPIEPHKGIQDAIWAFDILQYLGQNWHLVVIGNGSDRARLEEFARAIRAVARVHFLGPQSDVPALLAQAEVVWVPSRAVGGIQVALEAMAVGRPVIASRLPGLAEVVADGETGVLVPPGDKVALARQTRLLLGEDQLRTRMGTAGRERIRSRFSLAERVKQFARLYERARIA